MAARATVADNERRQAAAGKGRQQHRRNDRERTYYQLTFTPSWSCRASYVPRIVPNAAELRLPLGAWKFVRFRTLNASSRSSTFAALPNAICLVSEASSCQNQGARTLLRAALPNGWLGSVGATTQLELKYAVIVQLSLVGSQTTFGR